MATKKVPFGVWLDSEPAGRFRRACNELHWSHGEALRLLVEENIDRLERMAAAMRRERLRKPKGG